jgi:hypothetical protein
MPPNPISGSSTVKASYMHMKDADPVAPVAPAKLGGFKVVLEKGDGCDGEQSGQSLGRTDSYADCQSEWPGPAHCRSKE